MRKKWGCIYVSSTLYDWYIQFFRVFKIGSICCSDTFKEEVCFLSHCQQKKKKNCLEQMAKGDEEARNILIERNLRLVAHVAKKNIVILK